VLAGFLKLFKFFLYFTLIVLGVIFAVSNRSRVSLTFFPLPFNVEMPLFLFAIVVLTLGIWLGWMIAHWGGFRYRRARKNADKRVAALENELGGLRARPLVKPASLPPS